MNVTYMAWRHTMLREKRTTFVRTKPQQIKILSVTFLPHTAERAVKMTETRQTSSPPYI
jgi:hypothetical protein